MQQVGFFSKKIIIAICILFLVIGTIVFRFISQRDVAVQEHVGSYLTYVVTSDADLIHPQAWIIRFEGKVGLLERHQINCEGETKKIGSEPIQVINYSKSFAPTAQGSLAESINSLESYKFAVKFRIPKEQGLQCTMIFISDQKWPIVTCYEQSNVFRYVTMKINDVCEDKIRKISL